MRRLLSVVLVLLPAVPVLQAQMTADQKTLEFQQIAGLFAKRYSFLEWKRDNLGFDGLADSGGRRTGFRGEREKRSGVKANTIPG